MQPPGGEALGVEVEITPYVVGEAHGVGLVVDRERRPVPEHGRVAPEDARARGVEGGHPHAVRDGTDEIGDPLLHLARGLVGERDRQQPERRHPLLGHEERDAMREHARLAAPGTRDHEDRPVGCRRRLALHRVQPGEEGVGLGHQSIVPKAYICSMPHRALRDPVARGMPTCDATAARNAD